MNTSTSYGMDAYRSHTLDITMKTSSGDVIKMGFNNENAASMRYDNKNGSESSSLSFSSMQSFNFEMDSNGLDEQDKKEIEEFMKIAKPRIDNFLKELEEQSPKSPVSKVANDIASIFDPEKERDENTKNYTKNSIVSLFDDSMKNNKLPKEMQTDIFDNMRMLLEKTLERFDEFNKSIYA
ncbi:MAG: hypothetical protein JXQ66_00400 [Campylobacterales bacterium]|nr:hypothetical protein [Campylobacterales bacterium]